MMASIRLLATTWVIGVLAAGCGGTGKKAPTMTPDEANRELSAVARAVTEVIAPGGATDRNENGPPTPCGGPGGNEYSRIEYGLSLDLTPSTDRSAVFASTRARLRDLGYTVDDPQTMGANTSLTFHGEALSGDLTDHGDGTVSFGAQTWGLDNPDKDHPPPDVQPSS